MSDRGAKWSRALRRDPAGCTRPRLTAVFSLPTHCAVTVRARVSRVRRRVQGGVPVRGWDTAPDVSTQIRCSFVSNRVCVCNRRGVAPHSHRADQAAPELNRASSHRTSETDTRLLLLGLSPDSIEANTIRRSRAAGVPLAVPIAEERTGLRPPKIALADLALRITWRRNTRDGNRQRGHSMWIR